jgi:hypothetical protein
MASNLSVSVESVDVHDLANWWMPPPHTHTQAEDDPLSGVNDRPFVDPIEIKLWTPTNLRKEWVSKFAEEQGDPSPRPVQF